MAETDLAAEYDTRAMVPEHPEILAGWARDAEAYRAEMGARAELGLVYGASPRQIVEIFSPTGEGPLVVFIHGGWWRAFDPSWFSHMARGLNARGITVALAGYDLCPQVSIATIVGQMRKACLFLRQRTGRQMLVFGHSAGGHLAAAMVATDWKARGAPADLVPAGYAISGLFDLTRLLGVPVNADLGLDAASAQALSPLHWPPPSGAIFDAVVGALESNEFKRQSRTFAQAWNERGAVTRYEELPGNHFTVIAPLADPESAMVQRLTELAMRTWA